MTVTGVVDAADDSRMRVWLHLARRVSIQRLGRHSKFFQHVVFFDAGLEIGQRLTESALKEMHSAH